MCNNPSECLTTRQNVVVEPNRTEKKTTKKPNRFEPTIFRGAEKTEPNRKKKTNRTDSKKRPNRTEPTIFHGAEKTEPNRKKKRTEPISKKDRTEPNRRPPKFGITEPNRKSVRNYDLCHLYPLTCTHVPPSLEYFLKLDTLVLKTK